MGLLVQIWAHWGREVIGVCGGQRTEEGGREVVCVGCRHAVGKKKSKNRRRLGREGKAWGSSVPGEDVVYAPIKKVVCMEVCGPVENPSRESYEEGFL